MAEILAKAKSGELGPEIRAIYTNRSGNARGMNTRANAAKVVASKLSDIRANRITNLKMSAKAIGGAVQILQPFIGAYYAERAARLGAEIYDQDASNSIAVNALDF